MRPLSELMEFLTDTMSMTDVYQPAVVLHLLERGGSASKEDLARTLAGYDESVQDYYERILMRWPKKTLTKHQVVNYDKPKKTFTLDFELNDTATVEEIKTVCIRKIEEWIARKAARGGAAKVEASVRYRILKAARGKCELCGISAKICPIDIDHIVPQSKTDKERHVVKDGVRMHVDDERNLQALCFQCNRAKRDGDDTDFRPPTQKLVRDRIPEIIRESGRVPVTKRLEGEAFTAALLAKLVEEHVELLGELEESDEGREEKAVGEVVDMIEVLFSLGLALGSSEADTMHKLQVKRGENGGFASGTFLIVIQET